MSTQRYRRLSSLEIPCHVFRAYDIRGKADTELTPDFAYALGRAVGQMCLAADTSLVAVGRDGRLSSPNLASALIAGLTAASCRVMDIGLVPTPLLYYATYTTEARSGVMVTGSHNPGTDNGFKLVVDRRTLTTEAIQGLYQAMVDMDLMALTNDDERDSAQVTTVASPAVAASVQQVSVSSAYIREVAAACQLPTEIAPLRVVLDCGHGATGEVAPSLFKAMGCDVIPLYCDIDGCFPHHHPDPTVPENLQDLIVAVREHQADIGLAFDGDGDRVGVVTEQGEIIWPDRLMMFFAKQLLQAAQANANTNRQPIVIYDVKCSKGLDEVIRQYGGEPVMCRTGHSIMKNKLMETQALLAGEMSGHLFIHDHWYGFDDGMYVGARLVKFVTDAKLAAQPNQRAVSDLFDAFPKRVSTPELKIPMADDKKAAFMEKLLARPEFAPYEQITIDGLRLNLPKGWGLVRPSNTTPVLVVRFEADDETGLAEIQSLFRRVLWDMDATLALPF